MDAKVRPLLLVACLACLPLGCKTTDPAAELLESELRAQEDQIYHLDREVDRLYDQLASARRNNQSLRQQLAKQPRGGTDAAAGSSRPRVDRGAPANSPRPSAAESKPRSNATGPSLPPAIVPVPDPNSMDPEDLQVPQIELGPTHDSPRPSAANPAAEEEKAPPTGQSPTEPPAGGEASGRISPPRNERDPGDDPDLAAASGEVPNVNVARIALNSRLTGGLDVDGQPGDEALVVVIEPQNSAGQYLPLPGDLSIEVIDPQADPSLREFARWDFDASETVPFMKRSLLGKGIHLNLPWPAEPPSTESMQLLVRYRTPAGTELVARREVRLDVAASALSLEGSTSRSTEVAGEVRDDVSRGQVAADPLIPQPTATVQDLLPSQSTEPPRAPRPPALAAPAWNPQRVPEMLNDRSNVAEVPAVRRRIPSPSERNRGTQPAWKPYR